MPDISENPLPPIPDVANELRLHARKIRWIHYLGALTNGISSLFYWKWHKGKNELLANTALTSFAWCFFFCLTIGIIYVVTAFVCVIALIHPDRTLILVIGYLGPLPFMLVNLLFALRAVPKILRGDSKPYPLMPMKIAEKLAYFFAWFPFFPHTKPGEPPVQK
ncbi:MAG: hypothetical protein HZA50_05995 [Planctomycetes bacterium]|nr:hypothetical protein [Planctomycetota bacterium]